ncbi:MAG: slr1658 superfamily regulator [Gemmatimonadaceae bacterium]
MTPLPRTVGIFDEGAALAITSATVALPAMDFVVQWRRCGITADYVADYLAYAFERRDVARTVITTAANELLENAAKFTTDKKTAVRIVGRLRGTMLELEVENVSDATHIETLSAVLNALSRGEAPALFAERLESKERGGLGLIILAKDYAARLGARITPRSGAPDGVNGDSFSVTVRAAIDADQMEQR